MGGEDLTPAALLVRGQERFSKGDFDKAIEYWAGAAARDSELQEQLAPKLADAYRKRGALRYQAREYEEAYSDLREAMRLDPDSQNTRAACLLADQARSSPPRERPAAAASFWRQIAIELRRRLLQTNDIVRTYFEMNRALIENPTFREAYALCNR